MNGKINGWSVALAGLTLAAGIVLIMLGERDAGLITIGGSGWGGFAMKLAGGKVSHAKE